MSTAVRRLNAIIARGPQGIHALPPELISVILRTAIGEFDDAPHCYAPARTELCTRLRAHHNPYISSAKTLPPASAANVGTMYPRWNKILAEIQTHMNRCQTVVLVSESYAASSFILQRLCDMDGSCIVNLQFELRVGSLHHQRLRLTDPNLAKNPIIFGGSLPLLRSLAFTGTYILWNPLPFFANLDTLHLEGLFGEDTLSVDEYFTLFSTVTQLRDLHLVDVACVGFDTSDITPPTLSNLQRLYFASAADSACCLLSMLRMPMLRTLHLQIENSVIIDSFLEHCSVILGNIETLLLEMQFEGLVQVADFLSAVPRVRCIDCIGTYTFSSVVLHNVLLYWKNRCPDLSTLRLREFISKSMVDTLLFARRKLPANDEGIYGIKIISPESAEDDAVPTISSIRTGGLHRTRQASIIDYYEYND
ncbi:hypothetical protein C8J57DRAFT_1259888 [Mycena rebaudengoi]|nr:hypothetical protein C8J57DRAFT_1259888 [Mycena rebaudengoi]